jgi:membrane protein required for colicin V production
MDAAIVLIFIFFIVTGFRGGLVRELISLGATLVGLVMAGLLYDNLRDTLFTSIDNETVASAAAFLVIFFGIVIAGHLLATVVNPLIHILMLGMADQFLGAGFGVVKAFILVVATLTLLVTYPIWDLDETVAESDFATRLLDMSRPVTVLLPDIFENTVDAIDGPTAPIRDS